MLDVPVVGALTEIVIFVASPGDCAEERLRVRAAAEAVTEALGTQLDVRLRVTGWEQQQPDLGRPQGQINHLIDTCDVFIGLMNRRWGSPTGTHPSGFLEEFERASDRRVTGAGAVPKVALWFRRIPDDIMSDPGEQLKEVLVFQRRVRDERLALYQTFEGPDDLEAKLVVYLSGIVGSYVVTDERREVASAPTTDATTEDRLVDEKVDEARRQIAAATSSVTALADGSGDGDDPDADRLLLLALGLNSDDGVRLPVHVANRLYLRRADLVLSVMEHDAWLRTVLADFASGAPSSRVAPGWAVLGPNGPSQIVQDLVDLAATDDRDVVAGSLSVLRDLAARPEDLWAGGDAQDGAVARWVTAVGVAGPAAVAYAASVARPEDTPLLKAVASETAHEEITVLHDSLAGNVELLVKSVTGNYRSPAWQVRALSEALPHLHADHLRALVAGRNTPRPLRERAVIALASAGDLGVDSIAAAITKPSVVDTIFNAVGSGALSPAMVESALPAVKEKTERRDLTKRLRAYTVTTDELLSEMANQSGLSRADTWDSLSWSRDPDLVDIARRVYDTDAQEIVAPYLQIDGWPQRDSVVDYIRAVARVGALRILVSQDPPEARDIDRLLDELRRGNRTTSEDTLRLLVNIADESLLDALLEHRPSAFGDVAHCFRERALELGGADTARLLLDDPDPITRRAAAHALAADVSVGTSQLRHLLFDPDSEIRVIATDALTRRLRAWK